jgi:hypothetical protein
MSTILLRDVDGSVVLVRRSFCASNSNRLTTSVVDKEGWRPPHTRELISLIQGCESFKDATDVLYELLELARLIK